MATIPVTCDGASLALAATRPPLPKRSRTIQIEIEDSVRMAAPASPHQSVARILELRAREQGLLAGLHCTGSRDHYTRHLVYAGPGFTILALVWLPGQMSPIHGHRSWCAFGVREGALVETCFTLDGSTAETSPQLASHSTPGLILDGCRQLLPGMVSHGDGDKKRYHRVANLGVETAVSIHVYGVAFDSLGHGLNRIWEVEA